jgi:hypothetical protein
MTNISVRTLGSVLPPEKKALAREAYFIAVSRLGDDDSDFADIPPHRLDARLARLVLRLAVEGSECAAIISERALAALKARPQPRTLWIMGTPRKRGTRPFVLSVPLKGDSAA